MLEILGKTAHRIRVIVTIHFVWNSWTMTGKKRTNQTHTHILCLTNARHTSHTHTEKPKNMLRSLSFFPMNFNFVFFFYFWIHSLRITHIWHTVLLKYPHTCWFLSFSVFFCVCVSMTDHDGHDIPGSLSIQQMHFLPITRYSPTWAVMCVYHEENERNIVRSYCAYVHSSILWQFIVQLKCFWPNLAIYLGIFCYMYIWWYGFAFLTAFHSKLVQLNATIATGRCK